MKSDIASQDTRITALEAGATTAHNDLMIELRSIHDELNTLNTQVGRITGIIDPAGRETTMKK